MVKVSGGIGNTHFFFKWSFALKRIAIGISSYYPLNPKWHYGLFDIDSKDYTKEIEQYLKKWYSRIDFAYETPNGLHYLCLTPLDFRTTAKIMLGCPDIDISWFSIGLKRGYWFIENYVPIPKSLNDKYPIKYMQIQRIS